MKACILSEQQVARKGKAMMTNTRNLIITAAIVVLAIATYYGLTAYKWW
jgi:hypothetical protein